MQYTLLKRIILIKSFNLIHFPVSKNHAYKCVEISDVCYGIALAVISNNYISSWGTSANVQHLNIRGHLFLLHVDGITVFCTYILKVE